MAEKAIQLELDDVRRLTGKSLLWDEPGSIIDAFVSGVDKQQVVDHWQTAVRNLLDELGWHSEKTCYRIFENGISIAISAPLDALYAACDINETAWELTRKEFCGEAPSEPLSDSVQATLTLADQMKHLKQCIKDEVNSELLALIDLAREYQIPWLTDDDEFSLGYGATAKVWPVTALPNPNELDWQSFKTIPLALITGTNGKSTSVRILSQMVRQQGLCCGVTSTDFIRVGDNVLDYGDYSGPGGARMLLRHADAEAAILEVARGGILRRGLPVDRVDVALITNIAEDHLGQYGINTIEALARTKAVVAKGLDNNGVLVLNADDEQLVALSAELLPEKCWFSLQENNPVLQAHCQQGGAVCFVRDGKLVYETNHHEVEIVAVNDIPMTLNGAARHNIHNALGAIGCAKKLGIDDASIAAALKQFSSSVEDNPGRGNQFSVKGARVIMDFAHNAHSMDAMAATVANIPAPRKFLMLSMGGDRSDREVFESTHAALAMKPDVLVAADIEQYLRGRESGEIPQLIANAAIDWGMSAENIVIASGPYEGACKIVEQLRADDLALLLALSERDQIIQLLKDQPDESR